MEDITLEYHTTVDPDAFIVEYTGVYDVTWPCRVDALHVRLYLIMGQEVSPCRTCGVAAVLTLIKGWSDSSAESPQ